MCSSLGYHTFSIAYVNGKLSIEALSCWLALKLWISMFEVHINMHKSVCETIPLEGPEVLCRCAFGVKGGIEVGGLRKDGPLEELGGAICGGECWPMEVFKGHATTLHFQWWLFLMFNKVKSTLVLFLVLERVRRQ
jgi:hypothetical protein